MPVVAVRSSPNGLPIAITGSPTTRSALRPRGRGATPGGHALHAEHRRGRCSRPCRAPRAGLSVPSSKVTVDRRRRRRPRGRWSAPGRGGPPGSRSRGSRRRPRRAAVTCTTAGELSATTAWTLGAAPAGEAVSAAALRAPRAALGRAAGAWCRARRWSRRRPGCPVSASPPSTTRPPTTAGSSAPVSHAGGRRRRRRRRAERVGPLRSVSGHAHQSSHPAPGARVLRLREDDRRPRHTPATMPRRAPGEVPNVRPHPGGRGRAVHPHDRRVRPPRRRVLGGHGGPRATTRSTWSSARPSISWCST